MHFQQDEWQLAPANTLDTQHHTLIHLETGSPALVQNTPRQIVSKPRMPRDAPPHTALISGC
jgi:hypothetical protein